MPSKRWFAALALGLVPALPAQAQTVRPSQRINTTGLNQNGTNTQDGIGVAVQGTRFVAVWAEQFATTNATQDIYSSVSDDTGLTWSTPGRVDLGDANNLTDSELPKVHITQDGTIVAIWEEKREDAANGGAGWEDLFFNRSTDGGATWMPTSLALNPATAGAHVTSDVDRAALDGAANDLYVVWEEDSLSGLGLNEELWFTRSANAGQTWSAPVIISQNPPPPASVDPISDVDDPQVAVSGQSVVVAFADNTAGDDDIRILRSPNGGANWTGASVESQIGGDVSVPLLARHGDVVAIAYRDEEVGSNTGYAVHVVVSRDGGVTWDPEKILSVKQNAVVSATVHWHSVAVRRDNVYVVYAEDADSVAMGGTGGQNASKAYAAVSNDGGLSWTVDVPLAVNPALFNRPVVVATDNAVYVHLETGTNGSNQLVYTWSTDNGATWAPFVLVPGSGPDVDTENPSEGRFFAVDPLHNVALSAYWDRPTLRNEVYVSALVGTGTYGQFYCTAKSGLACGVPAITSQGVPEVGPSSGFTISATPARSNKSGILIYTSQGPGNFPFQGGILCLTPPLRRSPAVFSGGTLGCDGVFAIDMNAFASGALGGNPDAFLQVPGTLVGAQWWGRDSVSTGSFLSDAILYEQL